MADKEYVCAFGKHCLHHGEKVKASESVVLYRKHYHWDCAVKRQEIDECATAYIDCVEDKSTYPAARNIISNLILKYKIPSNYILKKISHSKSFYSGKPPHVLYGIRKMFFENELG